MLDTDILSEFLRGNLKVIAKVDEHLKEFGFIYLSIITLLRNIEWAFI